MTIAARQTSLRAKLEKLTKRNSSLTQLAMKGAVWTLTVYGWRQILRFGNNVILAWLLNPALLGLMQVVNPIILGLDLFSDVGIVPSIIQNKHGDEEPFLNTAWTIQVVRGFALWILACLISIPAARIYNEPVLLKVLPILGFGAVIFGLKSTKMASAQRRVDMRKIMLLELASYVISLLVMLIWALRSPSIWALVAGGLVVISCETLFSHIFLYGERNRFQWDKESANEIYRFGRWIFVSTAFTFLVVQSDRLIIGRLLGFEFLGIFSIALVLSRMFEQAIMQLGYRVLFPSYSEIERSHPEQLYNTLRKSRLMLIGLSWLAAFFLMTFGKPIVQLLYDDRYINAGWMLQILAVGTLVSVIGVTYDNVLVAKGKTHAVALLMAIHFVLLLSCVLVGKRVAGEIGVVVGLASVGWLIYPIKAFILARYKLWQPEVDLPLIGLATAIFTTFYYLVFT